MVCTVLQKDSSQTQVTRHELQLLLLFLKLVIALAYEFSREVCHEKVAMGSLPFPAFYSCSFSSLLPGEVMQYASSACYFKQSSSSSLWVPRWWTAQRPPMHSQLLHFNLITQHWRPVKGVCVSPLPPPPRTPPPSPHLLQFVLPHNNAIQNEAGSVCDPKLELPFGCHHWPCHHFVTCLYDLVNWSWVPELAFIPVECACSVSMRASPLTSHPRLSLLMVLVPCIPWICEVNVNPSHGADVEDSKNIKRRKPFGPFTHSFLSQPISCLSFSILFFFSLKKKRNVYQTPEFCFSASFYTSWRDWVCVKRKWQTLEG